MRPIVLLLTLVLFLSLSFAACDGSSFIFVPAVVGDGGSFVRIDLQLQPGTGNIYLGSSPRLAVSTQTSAEDAVFYAFSAAAQDPKECDVLIHIDGNRIANYVEGPSAGVAFGVLTYAAVTHHSILPDATVTGAMDSKGNVQPVGGVYEKVRAAAQQGARYFVMPQSSIQDRILLLPIKKAYPIRIIEVRNGQEAIDFLVYGVAPPEQNLSSLSPNPVPTTAPLYPSSLEPFRPLAQAMMDLHRQTLQALPESDPDTQALKRYFENDLQRQQVLMEKGYLFTAANEAFLDYVSTSTILHSDRIAQLSVDDRKVQINACLDALPALPKTAENWEWLAAADLRKAWARHRLVSTTLPEDALVEEKYYTFNQLQYAEGWCFISSQLRQLASTGGFPFPEENLRALAAEELAQAESLDPLVSSTDSADHAATARLLLEEGHYAASLFDSTYALSGEKARKEAADLSPEDLDSRLQRLLAENRTSLWGRIYQSQGAFLAGSGPGQPGQKLTAYQVLSYARALDALSGRILIAQGSVSAAPSPSLSWRVLGESPNPITSSLSPLEDILNQISQKSSSTSPSPAGPLPESGSCPVSFLFAFIFFSSVILWVRR